MFAFFNTRITLTDMLAVSAVLLGFMFAAAQPAESVVRSTPYKTAPRVSATIGEVAYLGECTLTRPARQRTAYVKCSDEPGERRFFKTLRSEDSMRNGYWFAFERGNRKGSSFIVWDGEVFYL